MAEKSTKINKDGIALNAWISKNVVVGEFSAKLEAIATACMVSRGTVNNWRNGLCRIPELYKKTICEVLGDPKIFDIDSNGEEA